jgi:predicted GNAT superfamily acetyltransferase
VAASQDAVIEIRQLSALEEFRTALELQQTIWGFDEIDLLPLRFFVVASRVGGQVLGAYDGERMIGFCLGIPGIKPGNRPYLHSHMMGVLPEYRNAGVGRRLKLRQREDALARGIPLIEWTFDPLELKNAFFNIERLGAIVRRYAVNQYGITGSPLHGGLPTDRCYAEWWIDSPRVRGILQGRRPETQVVERIAFPADIARIRTEENARAREIQAANASRFQAAFASGMAVTGFAHNPREGIYLLEPWNEN